MSVTIDGGVGEGLRIGLRRASGDYASGANERPVQQAVVAHLETGAVFYDVGANVGFFSMIAARCVGPTGTVVAFEPEPSNARCIEANMRRNRFDTVRVVTAAVGARSGEGELVVADHPGGATLGTRPAAPAGRVLRVRVVCLDDLVGDHALPPPTMVKIDVEGTELDVLAGASKVLADHEPTLVIEVDGASVAEVDRAQARLEQALRVAGYTWTALPPSYEGIAWEVRHLLAQPGRRRAG